MSPMKWFILNSVTQLSIIQMVCFQNLKITLFTNKKTQLKTNKMSWKW